MAHLIGMLTVGIFKREGEKGNGVSVSGAQLMAQERPLEEGGLNPGSRP